MLKLSNGVGDVYLLYIHRSLGVLCVITPPPNSQPSPHQANNRRTPHLPSSATVIYRTAAIFPNSHASQGTHWAKLSIDYLHDVSPAQSQRHHLVSGAPSYPGARPYISGHIAPCLPG
ncbi:hypothetical protein BGW36DRAFT_87643 [Talaromyces proteolyticus]|uniref:Uncharacterized protein n=1 Tax=Talaromyces proteolyticus TaxID=1131652 RepID=A0AAD4Q4Q5_9EURO|nr:uncharacterized protein BGW36DRAFT_87643 [Talaromyces proteolyticus]KAH8703506.1 hypothetical protein BGW36DRAFT_87643 [Talaromyces proteolyticus]